MAAKRSDSDTALLNPATDATAKTLIGLQRAAQKLRLERRIPASAAMAGNHISRFRGRGMDYAESRVYQPGDDIRAMDWRVTARAGKPHTKLYQEERERPVMLLADFSPSLFFGSRKALKSVIAAQTAALLAWATVSHGDRIGGLLFNGQHKEIAPRNGQRGALEIIRQLVRYSDPRRGLANPDGDANDFNEALKRLRRTVRPGSLVFLISDFYGVDDDTDRHLRRLNQHNDLVAIQILDPLEQAAPPPGRYAVTDGRQFGVLDTRSRRVREQYESWFREREQRLVELMRRHQIPLLTIRTTDDPSEKLPTWFGSSRRQSLQARSRAA